MSQLFVDDVVSKEGTQSVGFSKGVNVSASSTITGNLNVTGVLSYEDVTNVDSVGLITARSGIMIGAAGVGGTISSGGNVIFAGITTVGTGLTLADNIQARFGNAGDLRIYHDGSNNYIDAATSLTTFIRTAGTENAIAIVPNGTVELYFNASKKFETTNSGTITTGISTVTIGTDLDGYKVEEGSFDTNALNGEFDFELENGHVQTHTGSTAGTYFPDFRVSSSQSLSSVMDVGDVVSATLIVTASNTAHYCTAGIKIDNSTSNVTVEWIGSSAPSAGKGAGYDIYSFTIQKTAATPAYLVIVNATDAG